VIRKMNDVDFTESEKIVELMDEVLNLSWDLDKELGNEVRRYSKRIISMMELYENWVSDE
jgi:hypothetical protein